MGRIRGKASVIDLLAWQLKQHKQVAGEKVRKVDRVLDVRQGDLCWVVGTIYMDMPLKPNILDDISKDVSSPEPIVL